MVGSGINCVSQFTLEAVSHIKSAEKVLYCVTNAATAVYILELCPEALDLRVFYDDDKPRYATYVQMSEACLYFARQGLNVVAVFYGHPGVFVLPSHRAIQIAQKEGKRNSFSMYKLSDKILCIYGLFKKKRDILSFYVLLVPAGRFTIAE